MDRSDVKKKAERLRALHEGPGILAWCNVWDAASARIVEEAGFAALATMALSREIARELTKAGTCAGLTRDTISHREANRLFERQKGFRRPHCGGRSGREVVDEWVPSEIVFLRAVSRGLGGSFYKLARA